MKENRFSHLPGLLLALLAFLIAALPGGCAAEPAWPDVCPAMPTDEISLGGPLDRPPISMPPGQLLGRTRQENEASLFRPQGLPSITGWVTYGSGMQIRYRGGRAVALKLTLTNVADLGCEGAAAWAGFPSSSAPAQRGGDCSWAPGQLCYGSLPLAARWDGETAELHAWQDDGDAYSWWLAAIPLPLALGMGWRLLRRWKNHAGTIGLLFLLLFTACAPVLAIAAYRVE